MVLNMLETVFSFILEFPEVLVFPVLLIMICIPISLKNNTCIYYDSGVCKKTEDVCYTKSRKTCKWRNDT